jgi:hypothetical protein
MADNLRMRGFSLINWCCLGKKNEDIVIYIFEVTKMTQYEHQSNGWGAKYLP